MSTYMRSMCRPVRYIAFVAMVISESATLFGMFDSWSKTAENVLLSVALFSLFVMVIDFFLYLFFRRRGKSADSEKLPIDLKDL